MKQTLLFCCGLSFATSLQTVWIEHIWKRIRRRWYQTIKRWIRRDSIIWIHSWFTTLLWFSSLTEWCFWKCEQARIGVGLLGNGFVFILDWSEALIVLNYGTFYLINLLWINSLISMGTFMPLGFLETVLFFSFILGCFNFIILHNHWITY